MIIHNLVIKIHSLAYLAGHPCSGVTYVWTESGKERYAYTRVPWPLQQGPHQLAIEREAFLKRNGYVEQLAEKP